MTYLTHLALGDSEYCVWCPKCSCVADFDLKTVPGQSDLKGEWACPNDKSHGVKLTEYARED